MYSRGAIAKILEIIDFKFSPAYSNKPGSSVKHFWRVQSHIGRDAIFRNSRRLVKVAELTHS